MFKLEARPQASAFWRIASPLLALVLTVVLGVVLFMALGKDPVKGLQVFFWVPLRSGYALGELMVKATPLLLIALGLALCFRSNVWNIGAEGQYVMGAVFATGVALMADKTSSAWMVLPSEADDVFSARPSELWRAVLRRQGGRLAWVANAPDDLSAN